MCLVPLPRISTPINDDMKVDGSNATVSSPKELPVPAAFLCAFIPQLGLAFDHPVDKNPLCRVAIGMETVQDMIEPPWGGCATFLERGAGRATKLGRGVLASAMSDIALARTSAQFLFPRPAPRSREHGAHPKEARSYPELFPCRWQLCRRLSTGWSKASPVEGMKAREGRWHWQLF